MLPTESRSTLRKYFRQQRNAISNAQQQLASVQLLKQCKSLGIYQQAKTIACYLAQDGELSLTPLIEDAWYRGKDVCLPVLHPFAKGYLLFVRYHPNSTLQANRFGIPEPVINLPDIIPLEEVNLIFAPLVAFDEQSRRLGMGGGFYDRTLAPVLKNALETHICGVAHDCQKVETGLKSDRWDIPMQQIITPSKIYRAS